MADTGRAAQGAAAALADDWDMPPETGSVPLRPAPGEDGERGTRLRRRARRAFAVLGAAFAVYAVASLAGGNDEETPMRVADLAADPQRLGGVSGRTSEEYKEKVDTYSRRRAEASLKDGTSFVAPVSEVEKPRAPEPVTAPKISPRRRAEPPKPATSFAAGERARKPGAAAGAGAPQPAPERTARQERMERNETRHSRGDSELMSYLGGLRPREGQPMTYVFNRPSAAGARGAAARAAPAAETGGGAARAAASGSSGVPGTLPGDILYCLNRVSLNSDAPGPAMVEVVSGALRGAKAIGSFQRLNSHLVLRFSQLVTRDGVSYRISGYAIDPATDATAVRSGVDHHYLERWGGVVAASFLQGFGEAVQRSGLTTTSTAYGTTQSYPDYDINEQLWLGAARVGDRAASLFQSRFNMAPTVTLKGGTEIGLLLLDVGQGKKAGSLPAGTAGAGARTAARQAGQTGAAAGAAGAASGADNAYTDEITAEQRAARAREEALALPASGSGGAAGRSSTWQEGGGR